MANERGPGAEWAGRGGARARERAGPPAGAAETSVCGRGGKRGSAGMQSWGRASAADSVSAAAWTRAAGLCCGVVPTSVCGVRSRGASLRPPLPRWPPTPRPALPARARPRRTPQALSVHRVGPRGVGPPPARPAPRLPERGRGGGGGRRRGPVATGAGRRDAVPRAPGPVCGSGGGSHGRGSVARVRDGRVHCGRGRLVTRRAGCSWMVSALQRGYLGIGDGGWQRVPRSSTQRLSSRSPAKMGLAAPSSPLPSALAG